MPAWYYLQHSVEWYCQKEMQNQKSKAKKQCKNKIIFCALVSSNLVDFWTHKLILHTKGERRAIWVRALELIGFVQDKNCHIELSN